MTYDEILRFEISGEVEDYNPQEMAGWLWDKIEEVEEKNQVGITDFRLIRYETEDAPKANRYGKILYAVVGVMYAKQETI